MCLSLLMFSSSLRFGGRCTIITVLPPSVAFDSASSISLRTCSRNVWHGTSGLSCSSHGAPVMHRRLCRGRFGASLLLV